MSWLTILSKLATIVAAAALCFVIAVLGANFVDLRSGNSIIGLLEKSIFVLLPLISLIMISFGVFGRGPLAESSRPRRQSIGFYLFGMLLAALAIDYLLGGNLIAIAIRWIYAV